MKLKNNKAFMIILFFIFFILLNNVCFGADWWTFGDNNVFFAGNKYMYLAHGHNANYLPDNTNSIPDLEYFKDINVLKKLEIYKPYFWTNREGNTFYSTYIFLCYLNEFTGQAVFGYSHTETNKEFDNIIKNLEYYLIDFKRDIIINTTIADRSNNTTEFTSINIILNEDNEIQQIEAFSDIVGFKVFNVVDDYCTFVFSKASGSDAVVKELISLENNTYISSRSNLVSSGSAAGDYDTTIINYDSSNTIFVVSPFLTSELLHAFYVNGYINNDILSEFNYYKNTTNYLGSFYYTYHDLNIPVLYQRNLDILPQEITNEVALYLDDFNLKKRFSFSFNLPVRDENTKYYVFLEDYKRNSYNSATADLNIYTIDLPLDYDSLNYENYFYYDNILKKYLAPAGALIKKYSVSIDSGNTENVNLIEDYTGSRNPFTYNGIDMTYYILNSFIKADGVNDGYELNTLIPTNKITISNYLSNLLQTTIELILYKTGVIIDLPSLLDFFNTEDTGYFTYKYILQVFYYDHNLLDSYDNFIGGNDKIISYENSRNSFNKQNVYNLFRKTVVYNKDNLISFNSFAFNYSDNEDITSLLPENTDTTYLSSPFYKNNEESSSGGYITYNITNIYNYNDIIINYAEENSNMREPTDEKHYNNFSTGNNIVLNTENNKDIQKVELSTNDKWILDEIYNVLLKIEYNTRRFVDKYVVDNISNIYNNTQNVITETLVPDYALLGDSMNLVQDVAREHLGFVYEPFIFISFLFERIDTIEDNGIVFHSPQINIMGYQLLPEMNFDFEEQLFNSSEEMRFVRDIQLLVCNFTLVCMFINYFIRLFRKVFEKDFGGGKQ